MKKEKNKVVNSEGGTKTKVITVLLGLSFFCIFSFLLLIIFDKGLLQDDNTPNTKEVEEKEIDNDTVILLLDKIKIYGLDALYQETTDITFDKTPTNGQLFLAYVYNIEQLMEKYGESNTNNVTKEMMDKYFMDVYGYQPTTYKDIICQVEKEVLYTYKEDENKYVFNENHPGHGYYGPGFITYYVPNSRVKGNIYTVDVILLKGNEAEGYEVNGVDVSGKISPDEADYESELVAYFHEHHDEFVNGTKYRYVFEKVEDNYYLRSFSVVK